MTDLINQHQAGNFNNYNVRNVTKNIVIRSNHKVSKYVMFKIRLDDDNESDKNEDNDLQKAVKIASKKRKKSLGNAPDSSES